MTYQETLDWLFYQLPMYQNQGAKAYKEDLSNTLLLAKYLNNPEDKFKSIHVAGTNGKGSTSHIIASVLQEQGYKVGLYTSPHLIDFRERIKVDGQEISQDYVVDFIKKHKVFFEENSLSFFEMTVGLAFNYFADEKVDVAVIEVGLGGRLDSTNIVSPLVSVITNIGLDHTQFLGNTLEKIAAEKGGIIKNATPVVIGEFQEETFPVFSKIAADKKAQIYKAFEIDEGYTTDLLGGYQKKNVKTAVKTFQVLNSLGFKVADHSVEKGMLSVVKNTGLRGRYQIIQEEPKVICDTAHNFEGLSSVLGQLKKEKYNKLKIVLGVVDDKDLSKVVGLFPNDAEYYFTQPEIGRALTKEKLADVFEKENINGEKIETVKDAYELAKSNSANEDLIYVGGSTFVVADLLVYLNNK